jgi:hypothetical protein
MLKKHPFLILLVVTAIFISGCGPTPTPYVSVETIVAATYAASVAQTQAARPPNTPTLPPPTATRLPGTATPTPTATFLISTNTPTLTPTASPEPTATNITSGSGNLLYSCNIVSLSPQSVFRVKSNQDFTWEWVIQNTGTTRWDNNIVEVRFSDGTQMASRNVYEIDGPAKPGQTTTVKLKFSPPKEPGTYYTRWALRKGIHYFCYAELQIEVFK